MEAVDVARILAPLDASDESLAAAEHAVAVADRYDAAVHALYLVEKAVARGLRAGDIEGDTVAARMGEFMDAVEDLAAAQAVPLEHSTALAFSPSQLTHHPGSVILDAADDVAADFLVVPRERVTGDPDEVLGKAAEYVLMYASQPVLSV